MTDDRVSAPTSALAIARGRTQLKRGSYAGKLLEAAIGVEPMMEVLQTSALPLGYAAPAWASLTTMKGRQQSTAPLSSASPPRREIGAGEGTRTLDLLHGKQTL